MITEDYVSFETAKLLKEKGFNDKCRALYTSWFDEVEGPNEDRAENWNVEPKYFSAPTLQMAMRWLREVHKIGVFPTTFYHHTAIFDGHNYGCTLVNLETFDVIGNFEDCTFPADTYEESCEKAIKYCLKKLLK